MTEEKRGPGRRHGSRNRSTVVRTREFREAITPTEIREMARELHSMIMDREAQMSERIKALSLMLKYQIYSADVELAVDSEEGKPSAESMVKAIALLDQMRSS